MGLEGASARGFPQAGTKNPAHTAAATNCRGAHYRGEVTTDFHLQRLRAPQSAVDVLEIYGGWAEVSCQAHAFGLRASQPIEKDLGAEVADGSQTALRKLVQRPCPWLALWELPCTHWSRWQYVRQLLPPAGGAREPSTRRRNQGQRRGELLPRRRQAGQVLPARAAPRFGHVPDSRCREA